MALGVEIMGVGSDIYKHPVIYAGRVGKWKITAIRRAFRRFLDSFAAAALESLRWCHGQRPSTNAEAHPLDERVERCQVPRGTRHAGHRSARAAGVAAALGEGDVSSGLRVYAADGDVM